MNELIACFKIDVEKFSFNNIRPLHFKNKAVFDAVIELIKTETVTVLTLETPKRSFLNIIGMKKDDQAKVFYYKFTKSKPNLIPVFCELLGFYLEENEWVWLRDTFFQGDIIITPEEIIGDENLPLFYTSPSYGKA